MSWDLESMVSATGFLDVIADAPSCEIGGLESFFAAHVILLKTRRRSPPIRISQNGLAKDPKRRSRR